MVDTGDSKSSARDSVTVRVRSSVPVLKGKHMSIHDKEWIDKKLIQVAEIRAQVFEETVGTPSYDPSDYERLVLSNIFNHAETLLRELNRWKKSI